MFAESLYFASPASSLLIELVKRIVPTGNHSELGNVFVSLCEGPRPARGDNTIVVQLSQKVRLR